MRNLSEVHGLDLIRRAAQEKIKQEDNKSRVWSDIMNCWGFFAENPNEQDVFMIIGCSNPGDMFIPRKYGPYLFTVPDCKFLENTSDNDPHVILELKQLIVDETQVFGLEMLKSNPPMICQLLAYHKSMFKIAWESLS
ncbi:MAG: hypothetical protein EBU90_15280 [Proteobacteria bacterium]|nr:hypothetical protein [Pseudomonadota bacterium]